jgi:2-hydroxy-3-keto-5-methylthiopentenyl-1-phosphate phosphatase
MATSNIEIEPIIMKILNQKAQREKTTENELINKILKKEVEKESTIDCIEILSNKVEIINKDSYNPNTESYNKFVEIAKNSKSIDPVQDLLDLRTLNRY